VVVVLGVEVGAQGGDEHPAGPVAHPAQELALGAPVVPVAGDIDRLAVGQLEAGQSMASALACSLTGPAVLPYIRRQE
jgi:hypothetical protein